MEEKDLSEAIFKEFHPLKAKGLDLGSPDLVAFNLKSSMMTSCPATMILPSQFRVNGVPRLEIISGMHTANAPLPDTTFETLWNCTKEHYGLTATTAIVSAAGIPISKTAVGAWVHTGSSKTTNIASLIGMRFFPRTLIRQPTIARMAKATFGTVRVFGVIGRGIPFVAAGLAVFDLVSIGLCAYEAKNGR
ncbi:hypothetical protein [Pseudomonas viridiflava]|uniref:hypothetical protein n=1 Tax=Pseudomonas viridiflava TaxID=33069 RepID=UPI000F027D62|nr:hypothetical protein [Pseudomonas viridiflava]